MPAKIATVIARRELRCREANSRRSGAQHDRTTHQDREREVIEELEHVEIERFHVCIMPGTRPRFRARNERGGISDRSGRFRIGNKGARMPTYRDYFAEIKKRVK